MLVQLDQFEGPLGLLLYLIRKEEMDIYDIPIHRITGQYLEYIKQLQSFDLEQAGDFVAMAATLIQIKAKMLLPNYDENGEEVEEEDPRKNLVEKLLEYQKYQDASKNLYDRPLLGRDTLAKGRREELPQEDAGIELEESALFSLISMYRNVVRKAEKAQHKVAARFQSVASRILEIAQYILPGRQVNLKKLIQPQEWSATKFLITFLSALELGKLGYVGLFQSEDCGDIYLEGKKPIEGDVVTRVAEYDDGKEAESLSQLDAVASEVAEPEAEALEEMASDEDILAAVKSMTDDGMGGLDFEGDDTQSAIDIDSINRSVEETLNGGSSSDRDLESSNENASRESEVETEMITGEIG